MPCPLRSALVLEIEILFLAADVNLKFLVSFFLCKSGGSAATQAIHEEKFNVPTDATHKNLHNLPSTWLHLHLDDVALGNVPLTCGWFCEYSFIHHKPFWKHQAKSATFLPFNGTTRSDYNTGNSVPYSFRTVLGFFYVLQNCEQWRVARRGLRFYRPYSRRDNRLQV